jgi:hypothetical protein
VNYRLAVEGDYQQIFDLAQKHGIVKPTVGICFVAEEDGVITGFVNGGQVGYFESIASDTSIGATVLFSLLYGALLANTASSILAGVTNPIAGQMLEKYGFNKIQEQTFYLKKR